MSNQFKKPEEEERLQNQTEGAKKEEKGPPAFLKYIGLSFQLFVTIGLGTYVGWWVQRQSAMKFPLWLVLFCFFSVFVAFYHLWTSIKRDH